MAGRMDQVTESLHQVTESAIMDDAAAIGLAGFQLRGGQHERDNEFDRRFATGPPTPLSMYFDETRTSRADPLADIQLHNMVRGGFVVCSRFVLRPSSCLMKCKNRLLVYEHYTFARTRAFRPIQSNTVRYLTIR
eukprot:9438207-Pyramimonas_sp.AAC.1